jgi:hypothetical protein
VEPEESAIQAGRCALQTADDESSPTDQQATPSLQSVAAFIAAGNWPGSR